MGKLTKYTHDIAKHELICLVTYTLQDKVTKLEVKVTEAELLAANQHWGVSTLCSLLSSITNFTVTV